MQNMFGWIRRRKRKKLIALAWPESWSLHLNRNVRLTWAIDEQQLSRLQDCIKVIVYEKHWEGCNGLTLTEEMKVTIAAQAGLMLLGHPGFYFDNVPTILVYPQAFRRQTQSGWVMDETHRSGEAWQGGPIVLSWKDALRGGRNHDDGQNVVIHEFAHALDGLDGEMGGSVAFADRSLEESWAKTVDREFNNLVRQKEAGYRTLLDHYGATNHAEFFAVTCETFFESPHELHAQHRELFQLLSNYFHVDPRPWQGDSG